MDFLPSAVVLAFPDSSEAPRPAACEPGGDITRAARMAVRLPAGASSASAPSVLPCAGGSAARLMFTFRSGAREEGICLLTSCRNVALHKIAGYRLTKIRNCSDLRNGW